MHRMLFLIKEISDKLMHNNKEIDKCNEQVMIRMIVKFNELRDVHYEGIKIMPSLPVTQINY